MECGTLERVPLLFAITCRVRSLTRPTNSARGRLCEDEGGWTSELLPRLSGQEQFHHPL